MNFFIKIIFLYFFTLSSSLFSMGNSKSVLFDPNAGYVSFYYNETKKLGDAKFVATDNVKIPDIIKNPFPNKFKVEDYKFHKIDDFVIVQNGAFTRSGFFSFFDEFGNEILFKISAVFLKKVEKSQDLQLRGLLLIDFAICVSRVENRRVFSQFNELMSILNLKSPFVSYENAINEVFIQIKRKIWSELNPNRLDEILSQFCEAEVISK